MTPDDKEEAARKRRREREDELEQEEKEAKAKANALAHPGQSPADASVTKIGDLLDRAAPMLEQLNTLYNQYARGTERRPPLEVRKQLDQLIATLSVTAKPTPGLQFRYNSLHASYITYRDKWDKLMKDIEDGKIKRVLIPKPERK